LHHERGRIQRGKLDPRGEDQVVEIFLYQPRLAEFKGGEGEDSKSEDQYKETG